MQGGVERTLSSTAIGSTRRGTGGGSEHVAFQGHRPSILLTAGQCEVIDCSGDAVLLVGGNVAPAKIRRQVSVRREVTSGGRMSVPSDLCTFFTYTPVAPPL